MSRLFSILLIAIAAATSAAAEPPTHRPESHRPEPHQAEARQAEVRKPDSARQDARQPDSLGADWRQQQSEARAQVRSGHVAPLESVVRALRKRHPGRLLDAGLETDPDGRTVYRVRWAAADGHRVDFRVDATSGAVLSEH